MGTSNIVVIGAVFGAVMAVFVVVWVLLQRRSSAGAEGRWSSGGRKKVEARPSAASAKKRRMSSSEEPFGIRLARPFAAIWKVGDSSQSRLQELLVHAGFRHKGTVEVFLGAKFALALAMPALVVTVFLWRAHMYGVPISYRPLFTYAIISLIVGMMMPTVWLRGKARKRIDAVRFSLPDALDLLIVCVESGLGLDAAMLRISRDMAEAAPELTEDLALLNLEVAAGKPRDECLRNLALRTGCEEVESLTARINQAAKFGTNLGNSLRIHSETLRQKRRQQAEERAAKTSVKLLFPLVFFIFPAIFVVILGPAVVNLMEFFTSA